MPPKRRRRFQGLYYHSSPPKVLPMNGQIANSNGRRTRGPDDLSVKLSTIRIWMHEKDIGKLTRVLWAGQGNRLRQQASTNAKVKRFLAAVPYVMNSIKDVHQAVIDNSLENLQTHLEPPVPPALVTCRDANGLNLIHKAAGLGHATILEYLITTWPDGVHETDVTGKTPLHWAASAKNNMRCYTLLTQAGCDEEAVDYKMKTPSFYRHKPHEIERAFLAYVPEAPRVSPDITTDWEALSDESGDGKKWDIKIPEMNGFGRHSNAESNDNTSEAEMTEPASAHEDEDAANENIEPDAKEDKINEPAAEEETTNNNEHDDVNGQSEADNDQEGHDEHTEEETGEENETDKVEADEYQEEGEEEAQPQDEKQQTQTLTETTANLVEDSQIEDTKENEQEKEHEIDVKEDHDNMVKGKTNGVEEADKLKEDLEEKPNAKTQEEQVNEANEMSTREQTPDIKENAISEKQTTADEHKNTSLDEANNLESIKEENKLENEKQENYKKIADEASKPESPATSAKDLETNTHENMSNNEEDKKETGEENEKSSPENVSENRIDGEENVENRIEEESKTLSETLSDIKDEVKDKVEQLTKQIKNAFSNENGEEEEKEEQEKKDEIIVKETSETKTDGNTEFKDEKQAADQKEQDTIATNTEKQTGEHKQEANVKDNGSPEKSQKVDTKDIKTPQEDIKQEIEITQENLEDQTPPSSGGSSSRAIVDAEKPDLENSNKTIEPQTETTSSPNSHGSNETTPTNLQTPPAAAPKTPTNESPKKINDKTEEDENNNKNENSNSKLANKLEIVATTAKATTPAEAITDEQFKEIDKSLEEYKKAEESSKATTPAEAITDQQFKDLDKSLEEDKPEKQETSQPDMADKLEELADNLKENVKTMAGKVMNVFSNASESKNETAKLDNGSNEVVPPSESPQKQKSGKKLKKVDESSEDTADEDEEPQADTAPEENNNKIEQQNDTEPETHEDAAAEVPNETNAEEEQEEEEEEEEGEKDQEKEKELEEEEEQRHNDDTLADEAQDGEGSPTPSLAIEGFVHGEAEDNTNQSQTAAYADDHDDHNDDDDDDEETRLQKIIAAGDMDQLAQIVLNGDGQRLLHVEAKEPGIQAFLDHVPNYMKKIRRVHEAARQGNLIVLQHSLDRRKFAIAKDEISPHGATPLHVAVLFGSSDIVRYLAARFPETTAITDNDGRTALHYAAVISDNGHFYNVLLQLGSNPKQIDKLGYTPSDYLNREDLSETLNYGQLLKRFGAENLEKQLLSDQGQIENQSIQENPLFKTEQGKYLAENLADPLIKGLTQVAQKRPNDPLQYLASYLQNYVASRNLNGRNITQAAVVNSGSSKTDSTILVSAQNSTPPDKQMNGHINHNETENIEELNDATDDVNDGNDSDSAMSKRLEKRDEHGQSLLHFACARPQRKGSLVRVITESDVDITYRDELYRTARDVALQASHAANAKELDNYVMSLAIVGDIKPFEHLAISGYDHIIDVVDDNKTPIIDVAEARGLHDLATYLRTIRPLEELREELHQMIRDNVVGRVMEIADGPSGKWLIKAKNYYGRTALHIAILKESVEIVEHFVNRCPEALKIGDNLERTPLHYAMGTSIIESISRILIQNGAKRTYKDLKGRQPSYYFMNKADILRLQEEEDESR